MEFQDHAVFGDEDTAMPHKVEDRYCRRVVQPRSQVLHVPGALREQLFPRNLPTCKCGQCSIELPGTILNMVTYRDFQLMDGKAYSYFTMMKKLHMQMGISVMLDNVGRNSS